METAAALVGADGGVELHTVAAVDLHLAGIIHPGNAEHDGALGLHNTVHNTLFDQLGALLNHGFQRLQHFPHRLQIFLLMTVANNQIRVNRNQLFILQRHIQNSFTGYFLFMVLHYTVSRMKMQVIFLKLHKMTAFMQKRAAIWPPLMDEVAKSV